MKLFATDLDGTLLNEKHSVSPENKQAILRAKEQGIHIVVATGRSYHAAKKPLDEAGLSCPVICLNGAKVHNDAGDILATSPLDIKSCRNIQQTCQDNDMYFEIFTNQGGFSESRDQFIDVMVDIMKTSFPDANIEDVRKRATDRFQEEEITIIEDFEELFAREDLEVYKILAFSLDEQTLNNVYEQLNGNDTIAVTSSGASNLEFNHPNAQKGIALEKYAKQLGIEMKDVMTIGDNFNDLSMLTMAGRGVAMGNAEPEIIEACDYTTKTNKENGVAHAIDEMLQELNER
ncbi:Cof-type HAD-IIB family hydrolase [Gracilibacillus sp. S3-1-1]|uniref:Cof-type HAD-IIB family hydrolase n=1 Tax=Gracilibacillus pellucidus TaxID=3095368 RepID=A0ACC6M4N8_9BACI|nr:Cof-type HAD-IIB family hydrolase [Gracilibacillus sp. S3-1-1]MDX8045860.1 Cof-type HAD-IIB family hydrolase [Gracilibacillus sp. S3-1-1]